MTITDTEAQAKTGNAHPSPSAPVEPSPREFPDPFYCPITKNIFDDPVVIPDGDSYERSAIIQRGDVPAESLYSNRALKSIMDETVELSGGSLRAGLKRFDKSVRSTFHLLLDQSALPSHEYRPLSEAYYCSITFTLMHDPVIDPDGQTYERVAIENWISVNGTSPTTRSELTVEDLYSNHAISDLIDIEKNRSEETMHPSIRKFKEESPPERTDAEMGGNVVAEANAEAATNNRYPTTQAEVNALRNRQTQASCSVFALVFTFIVLIMFVPFGLYFAFGLCVCVACFGKTQLNQE